MHVFRAMLLLCLNLFFRMLLASASILDRALESGPNARQIERALSSKVSQGARVYLPDSVGYANATTRWSAAEHPDFAVVVAPATSEDVAATVRPYYPFNSYDTDQMLQVRMANILRIPFLAVNRGHGSTVDLNKCHRGINIHIQSLDSIALSEDRQSATLGGGVYTDQVIRALAPNGKSAGNEPFPLKSLHWMTDTTIQRLAPAPAWGRWDLASAAASDDIKASMASSLTTSSS